MAAEHREGAEPLVRLEHVGVTHPDAEEPSPRDVTFDIRPGEVVLLVGPSGCGKSTLAMAACGLIPHSHDADLDGRIVLGGLDTATSVPAELARRVAMVFQDPDAQIVTGRVFDEVAFALENLLLPADEVRRRAEAALRTVGLWTRRDDDPAVLSGGGRQRLAVACALAMRPDLLVLDEPTANLDPVGAADVYRAIGSLVDEDASRAVLLVEHDLSVALPLATRVVVLDHAGRVVLDGAPDDVFGVHTDVVRALGVGPAPAASAALPAPADPAAAPAIRARSLTVARGRGRAMRELLRDVSLEIPRGSFTAIVGPNGAGKTTLAQALAGVVPPPRGAVELPGEAGTLDPATARPRELAARVGFVFQNPEHQFVAHTVRDELAHGLRGLPRDERDARVDEMLGRFGLTAHAERHPFRLSGGQKRRLSVGTALIGGADRPGGILVLDEPTFGQDRARAEELLSLLDALHRRGTTIVVVTHDPDLVRRHATHVAAVSGGRLRAFGPTAEVLPLTQERAFWEEGVADEAAPDAAPSDARAERRPSPLERIDALALLAAVLPAMIGLIFTRDVVTPAIAIAASYAVVLAGAPKTRALARWLALILPVMAVAIGAGFSLWSDVPTGAATGLRLTALLTLALVPGLSTHGTAFVRAAVAHLRVPYRIGYAALASVRFIPRFRHELGVIRAAHRVRGTGGSPLTRWLTALVPLLASAIRHAERVALAMDARAFGAYPTRTERNPPRWRTRDTVAVAIGWAATAAMFVAGALVAM